MTDYSKMTSVQLDALREIGNIGAGHAATSLAGMINKKVMIDVCQIDLVNIKDLAGIFNHEHGDILDVQLGFSGDINGSIHYVMPKEEASNFVAMLTVRPRGSSKELDGADLAVLKECGGILLTSYLGAISDFLKFSLVFAAPDIECVNRVDFISKRLPQRHTANEAGFCIETAFIIDLPSAKPSAGITKEKVNKAKNRIKVYFVLIPDNHGLELIVKRLRIG